MFVEEEIHWYTGTMTEPMRNFTRRVEDFVCGHCGHTVKGNGFTNHCPKCLYSQHVDIHPGDRAAVCGGLMAPVRVEPFDDGYKVLQRCERCGFERRNRTMPDDNFEQLLAVIDKQTKTK